MREGRTATAEYRRMMEDQHFAMSLSLPPLAGLFYGTLLGAVAGAIVGLGRGNGVSAQAGAVLGMLTGQVLLAFAAAIALAFVAIRRGAGLSWRERIARRALLVISPLVIVPCVWYCLRTVIRQRHPELHH
jgi:hypothetical protein